MEILLSSTLSRKKMLTLFLVGFSAAACNKTATPPDNTIIGSDEFATTTIIFPKGKTSPENGSLSYKIKAGALLERSQRLEDINQRPFRCKIIVEASLPRVRISGGIGLSDEARVRQSWSAVGTANNPDITHTFALRWEEWKIEQASWDGNPLPFMPQGKIAFDLLRPNWLYI